MPSPPNVGPSPRLVLDPRRLGAHWTAEPERVDLYPADSTGDLFVCRSHDDEPRTAVSFGRLADDTPYVYAGGRITLRSA